MSAAVANNSLHTYAQLSAALRILTRIRCNKVLCTLGVRSSPQRGITHVEREYTRYAVTIKTKACRCAPVCSRKAQQTPLRCFSRSLRFCKRISIYSAKSF
ncbi:unnamed protein product [Pylaiella littoralis]